MKLLSLLFILVALISCDQQLESGLEPGEASFKISLNLNENPYSKQIKKIIGELKRNNESVVFDFDIDPDNSLAKAVLSHIATGFWILSVKAFKDLNGDTLLYSGTASVQIKKNQPELIDIYLTDDSGSLIVNINWQDSQFYVSETEHFIFKIPIDYFDERVIIVVKENNPYSTVKLYADRIWSNWQTAESFGDSYFEFQSILSNNSYEIHLNKKNFPDLTLNEISQIDSYIDIYSDNGDLLEYAYFDYSFPDLKWGVEHKNKRPKKLRLKAN